VNATFVILAPPASAEIDLSIATVDSTGNVGMWTSMAIRPPDRPAIAYFDATNRALKYAELVGGSWVRQVVDTAAGRCASLAFDGSGNPQIAYLQAPIQSQGGDVGPYPSVLKYARASGAGWAIETIGPSPVVGDFTSLAVDATGDPHISFHSYETGLWYAHKEAGTWTLEHVEGVNDQPGYWSSIAVDDEGRPHIGYWYDYSITHGNVRYATRTPGGWVIEELTGECGTYFPYTAVSLTLTPAGEPAIAYQRPHWWDEPFGFLLAVRQPGGWIYDFIDGEHLMPLWSCSLAYDLDGAPHLTYLAGTDLPQAELRYATKGATWQTLTVDNTSPSCGFHNSIKADGQGVLHASYYDRTHGDLKYFALDPSVSQFLLTVTSTGNGSVAKSPDQASYDAGTLVTLTATPEAGWYFSHWGGDAAGDTNPIQVAMDADKTIIATFERDFVNFGTGFAGVDYCSGAWGDYDLDGDLDLVLTGWTGAEPATHLYRNEGSGAFIDIPSALPHISQASVAWGDYDSDGDLDLLLAGRLAGTGDTTAVYRNDGGGTFVDIAAGLPAVRYASVAWGDCDRDGDLDVLLTGLAFGPGSISRIYRNQGGGVFTDLNAGLPGVVNGSAAWGDCDGDGDLDIALMGRTGGGAIARIYLNDGSGTLVDLEAGLPGVSWGSAAWGDYDNDGDLDLLLAGWTDVLNVALTRLFRNDPGPVFVDVGAGLPPLGNASAAWGDGDSDGDIDILLSGTQDGVGSLTAIYRNDGFGSFAEAGAGLPAVTRGSVGWVDVDNDGDLDVQVAGMPPEGARIAEVFENRGSAVNTPPSPPTFASAAMMGNVAHFIWEGSTDEETPTAGLSYNMRVSTTPGGNDVVTAMSAPDGYRRIVHPGNASRQSWLDLTLPRGSYYWSIQAVDAGFAGSAFTEEGYFFNQSGVEEEVPRSLSFVEAGPNPAAGRLELRFGLPERAHVKLAIYDVAGRRVAELLDEERDAGFHAVSWRSPAAGLGAGVYFARLTVDERTFTRKVVLIP
jgi:hypothetical protein